MFRVEVCIGRGIPLLRVHSYSVYCKKRNHISLWCSGSTQLLGSWGKSSILLRETSKNMKAKVIEDCNKICATLDEYTQVDSIEDTNIVFTKIKIRTAT